LDPSIITYADIGEGLRERTNPRVVWEGVLTESSAAAVFALAACGTTSSARIVHQTTLAHPTQPPIHAQLIWESLAGKEAAPGWLLTLNVPCDAQDPQFGNPEERVAAWDGNLMRITVVGDQDQSSFLTRLDRDQVNVNPPRLVSHPLKVPRIQDPRSLRKILIEEGPRSEGLDAS
jgi:hypothetical protein